MSRIVKGIFGGSSSSEGTLRNFNPAGFSSAGLSGSFSGNQFNLTRGAEGNQAISALVGASGSAARDFRGLRDEVRPGFGRLTRSRVEAIRGAGSRAVGNLREELSKRRVAGSSFAEREVASTEAEFGRLEEQARSEALIQEIGLTSELIGKEFESALQGIMGTLNQLNFESGLGAQLSAQAGAQINANLTAQAEARAAQEAAGEDFLGSLIGLASGGSGFFGKIFKSIF